ncbi:MAG TPA: TerC/Alx family metal homeostasis membrane protein [Streptosporangiaceae bacterium]|nr:TerC/Alx family metal homeostasis membrane protein [Streptosporangiaceae bacterium]
MTVPWWAWAGTLAVFAAGILVDLVAARNIGTGLRGAAAASALWVAAGLAFGGILWLAQGSAVAGQYFAGYLLEKALSVDNIFVFVLLLGSLAVPVRLQRRVLLLGVVGALIMRGGFIAAGGALIEHISWIFYVFGAVVLLAGARMFRPAPAAGPEQNLTVRGLRRILPITGDYAGSRFLTRVNGKIMFTPLFVALVAIETTDLVFALDSIPAVFGVTRNLFVVFTSNAFAVLGLRALYFLLAGSVDRFRYLKQGLALLLVFIGAKMLLSPVIHIPVLASLGVIVLVVAGAVAASLWRDRGRPRPDRDVADSQNEGPADQHSADAPGKHSADAPGKHSELVPD